MQPSLTEDMLLPSPIVYVVDDDASVRKSLARLLRAAGHQAQTFASPAEFLDRCHAGPLAGCAVFDVQMPGVSGLELQQALLEAKVRIPIIFITGYGDIPTSVKAMKAGAVDFLPKPFRDEDLLAAIRLAIARDHEQQSLRNERDALVELYAVLTPRERDVMALVVAGLMNKQIAVKLGSSEKTVKIHRGRMMQKMRVQSVADLVRAAEKLALGASLTAGPSS
jgi:FixJ family two-component response regulator